MKAIHESRALEQAPASTARTREEYIPLRQSSQAFSLLVDALRYRS